MAVTLGQALAFLEVLAGHEQVDEEEFGPPKSPYVLAHLEAVLGSECVPTPDEVNWLLWTQTPNNFARLRHIQQRRQDNEAELAAFINYLEGVAAALKRVLGHRKKRTCANCGYRSDDNRCNITGLSTGESPSRLLPDPVDCPCWKEGKP